MEPTPTSHEEWLRHWKLKTGSPTFGQMAREEPTYDPDEQVFVLKAESLFDKGGFLDGDLFLDQFLDHCAAQGIRRQVGGDHYWYADVLKELVETHLLPLIPFKLRLETVSTVHNPVRCFDVEGVGEDQLCDFRDACKGVEARLTWRQVRQFVDEKIALGLLKKRN